MTSKISMSDVINIKTLRNRAIPTCWSISLLIMPSNVEPSRKRASSSLRRRPRMTVRVIRRILMLDVLLDSTAMTYDDDPTRYEHRQ